MFTSVKNAVHSTYLHVADKVVPTMTESCFIEKGMLTPEEFVAAGDLLVFKCRTWTWEAGDPAKAVPYLPKDKQFLMTRNIKCTGSAEEELSSAADTTVSDGGDDDWVTTAASAAPSKAADDVVVAADAAAPAAAAAAAPAASTAAPEAEKAPVKLSELAANDDDDDDDDDDDVDFVDDDDDDAIATAPIKSEEKKATEEEEKKEKRNDECGNSSEEGNKVVKTRTYDLSITYDHYYRTPRAWLYGYDQHMKPLTPQQIFEDISGSHAHKTVTMDAHPHLGIQEAYIHPCKHADVMKKMIERQIEQGKTPRVDQYLILFIKFLASVIPSLDYDFTLDVD